MNLKNSLICWCREGTSDKVWGAIGISSVTNLPFMTQNWVVFWGRRGGSLHTKLFQRSSHAMSQQFCKKLNQGYRRVNVEKLHEVYPEFEQDLEKTTMWAMLKGL